MLRKYEFKQPGSTEPVRWQLWDSMGWGSDDYKRGELGFILDGNLPNMCDLTKSISTRTEGFKAHPGLQDRVHCMLLVVPCSAATDEAYMTRLQEMRQFARERGQFLHFSSYIAYAAAMSALWLCAGKSDNKQLAYQHASTCAMLPATGLR